MEHTNEVEFIIADTDESALSMLSTKLKVLGQKVSVAHDGIEAFVLILGSKAEHIILLTEIHLPFLNAYHLVEELNREAGRYENVKKIILSSLDKSKLPQGFASKIDGYIKKPASNQSIFALVNSFIAA